MACIRSHVAGAADMVRRHTSRPDLFTLPISNVQRRNLFQTLASIREFSSLSSRSFTFVFCVAQQSQLWDSSMEA